ncbi:MAG: prolyl oligopeptidase family serine peptidase [Acutalibacteraceae bacterium]|jgi:hypothetical protein
MNIADISKFSSASILGVNPNQLEIFADNLTRQNLERGDKVREQVKDEAALKEYQAAVRASFNRAICGLPEKVEVKVNITKTFETEGLQCENLILETLPGWFATANVYKPLNSEGKLPAVLMVCGHSAEGRMDEDYQNVQRLIARAGFVVMGLDPLGQGERFSYLEEGRDKPCIPPCVKEHEYAGIQCLLAGTTVTRYFVHDGISALDYLASRSDVIPDKIGVTGSSGGGTQTSMLMMAAPEKIAAAAPATFVTDRMAIMNTRIPQDLEQIWPDMAKDGFDHADILACMAPKPVMLLLADSDFFPLEGSHRSLEKARKLWAISGNEDKLEEFTDASRHNFTHNLANAAADFFSRALKGSPAPYREKEKILELPLLQATKTGQVVTSLSSRIVHDFVLDELKQIDKKKAEQSPAERRQKASDFVASLLKKADDYPLYIKRIYPKENMDLSVYNLDLQPLTWFVQEDIYNFGIYFKKYSENPDKTVIALWDGGVTLLHRYLCSIMELCEQGYGVFVVDLTGTGTVSDGLYHYWNPDFYYTRLTKFCADLLVNGDSLPAMRVRGVLKAVDVAEDIAGKGSEISILTHGHFNLYALMAKLADSRIKKVTERAPLESLRSLAEQKYYNHNNAYTVMLPGILQVFDIEDLREFTKED